MVYEWDAQKARRASLIKMSAAFAAAIAVVAVPVWFVIEAIHG